MRLPFVKICVAVATCLVGVGVRASEVPATERLLRTHMGAHDEEERGNNAGADLIASAAKKLGFEPTNAMTTTESVTSATEKYEVSMKAGILESPASALSLKFTIDRFEGWLKAETPPQMVFKELEVDKVTNIVLLDYCLAVLSDYVTVFNQAFPKKKTTITETLLTYYDADGVKTIEKLLKSSLPLAKDIELLQQGIDPDDVFKSMGLLGLEGVDLFSSALLQRWVMYADAFNKVYPEKKTPLLYILGDQKSVVEYLFNAKDAPLEGTAERILQEELIESWLVFDHTPADVFLRLGVMENQDAVFNSRRYAVWMEYMNKFNAGHPANPVWYISVLRSMYERGEVASPGRKVRDDQKNSK